MKDKKIKKLSKYRVFPSKGFTWRGYIFAIFYNFYRKKIKKRFKNGKN